MSIFKGVFPSRGISYKLEKLVVAVTRILLSFVYAIGVGSTYGMFVVLIEECFRPWCYFGGGLSPLDGCFSIEFWFKTEFLFRIELKFSSESEKSPEVFTSFLIFKRLSSS